MGKNTISESMPTIAPRDHVAPETPLSETPLVPKSHAASKYRNLRARLPFDRVVLLLQGGGALGPYQAGVYEALAETGLHPDGTGLKSRSAAVSGRTKVCYPFSRKHGRHQAVKRRDFITLVGGAAARLGAECRRSEC